jgi:hypothetical protein
MIACLIELLQRGGMRRRVLWIGSHITSKKSTGLDWIYHGSGPRGGGGIVMEILASLCFTSYRAMATRAYLAR